MAATRMTHPEHGYHVSYDSAEKKRLEESGWKPITDAEFKARIAAKNAVVEEVEDKPAPVVAKGKPGRKAKAAA